MKPKVDLCSPPTHAHNYTLTSPTYTLTHTHEQALIQTHALTYNKIILFLRSLTQSSQLTSQVGGIFLIFFSMKKLERGKVKLFT